MKLKTSIKGRFWSFILILSLIQLSTMKPLNAQQTPIRLNINWSNLRNAKIMRYTVPGFDQLRLDKKH